jgi:hypothetical protein
MLSLTSELSHGENSDGIPSGLQNFCSPEQDQGDGNDVTDLEQYYASAENSVQRYSRAESCTGQHGGEQVRLTDQSKYNDPDSDKD